MARARRDADAGGAEARPPRAVVWLADRIRTPPLSEAARVEAGMLLRRLQEGEVLSMPQSRPMPAIGPRCHELRINDENRTWRVFHRTDEDAVVVVHVTDKTTRATPRRVIDLCQSRLAAYDEAANNAGDR